MLQDLLSAIEAKYEVWKFDPKVTILAKVFQDAFMSSVVIKELVHPVNKLGKHPSTFRAS